MEEIENHVDSNEINLIGRSTVDENREEIKTLQEYKQQVESEFNQKLETEVKPEMKKEVEEKMKEGLEKQNLDEIESFKLKLQDQVDKLKKSVDLLNGDLLRERKLVFEMGTIQEKLDLQVEESRDLKSKIKKLEKNNEVLIQNGLSEVETEENEKLVKGKNTLESVKKSVKNEKSLKALDDLKQDKEDRIVLRKENIEKNINYQLSKIDDLEKYFQELVAKIATLEKNDKMLGIQFEERDESFQRLLGEKCLFEQKLVDLGKMFEELKRKKGEILAQKNKIDKDDNMLRNKVEEESKETIESFEGLFLEKCLSEQELVDSEKMFEELKRENQIEKKSLQRPVKGMKTIGLIVCSFVLMGLIITPTQVEATGYTVGGHLGWTSNVNYTLWKSNITFFRNDWLIFQYDSNRISLLQVNKHDYELCEEDHPIRSWSSGFGTRLVPLNITKTYYFISGNEFCYEGVKISIDVVEPSPPSPSRNSSSQVYALIPVVFLVFIAFLIIIPN